jgi:hypothetical protein
MISSPNSASSVFRGFLISDHSANQIGIEIVAAFTSYISYWE